MLSEPNRAKIKEEILLKINQTKDSILSLTKQIKPVSPDNAIGRITRMDAIQQKNMAEANLRDAEEMLRNLDQALEKIDEPDFGICILCKKPIVLDRILFLPHIKTCVNCA